MIEKLFEAITAKNMRIVEMMELFGDDHWHVKNEIHVIEGMKDAFEIIAGHSYTDHLLARVDAELDLAM